MQTLSFKTYRGREIETVLEPLAQLRIIVFRDFPYLYDGTPEHEKEYLKTYIEAESSFLFAAFDADRMVGATTCIALIHETPEVQEPFIAAGIPLEKVCYLGESILLASYRGKGLGVRFFEEREAHARSLGTGTTAFCAVQRPPTHPMRPAEYQDLTGFWTNRGYTKSDHLVSYFSWKDTGRNEETSKPMEYWTKSW